MGGVEVLLKVVGCSGRPAAFSSHPHYIILSKFLIFLDELRNCAVILFIHFLLYARYNGNSDLIIINNRYMILINFKTNI